MSATARAPTYGVITIDTSVPNELPVGNAQGPGGADLGQRTITGEFDYLAVVNALDGLGNINPTAALSVIIGRSNSAAIPMRINAQLSGEATEIKLQWTVQAGSFAVLACYRGGQPPGVQIAAPPAVQVTTSSSVGTTLTTTNVATGAAATQVAASGSNRQSVTVEALSTNTASVFVGGATVTTGNGIELQPGQAVTIDKTTAAVFAISAAAQNVRVMVEQ